MSSDTLLHLHVELFARETKLLCMYVEAWNYIYTEGVRGL